MRPHRGLSRSRRGGVRRPAGPVLALTAVAASPPRAWGGEGALSPRSGTGTGTGTILRATSGTPPHSRSGASPGYELRGRGRQALALNAAALQRWCRSALRDQDAPFAPPRPARAPAPRGSAAPCPTGDLRNLRTAPARERKAMALAPVIEHKWCSRIGNKQNNAAGPNQKAPGGGRRSRD